MTERRIIGYRRRVLPWRPLHKCWLDEHGNLQPDYPTVEPVYDDDPHAAEFLAEVARQKAEE